MNALYQSLSKVSFLCKNFTLKIIFVCFLGIHLPLLAIIMAIPLHTLIQSRGTIFFVLLIDFACTTTLTMFVVKNLLKPLPLAQKSLEDYQTSHILPALPVGCDDEVGLLMKKIQNFVTELDTHITNKNDMVALLSHDMRTPFVQLSNYAALIEGDTDDEIIRDTCKSMMAITENQLNFLENVLKLLVIDDMVVHYSYEPANISGIIDEALLGLASQTEAKNIAIKKDFDPSLELIINKYSMTHLFQNLLSNAIKFSYPNGEIVIRAQRREKDFIVEVTDRGAGFDAESADRIFSRFTKGKSGTMGERSTGLGLYLVKKIAEQNNGKIMATSGGKNKGAKFTISFPLNLVVCADNKIQQTALTSAG